MMQISNRPLTGLDGRSPLAAAALLAIIAYALAGFMRARRPRRKKKNSLSGDHRIDTQTLQTFR